MKYIQVNGSESDVKAAFSQLGFTPSDTDLILDYLFRNKQFLCETESAEIRREYIGGPPGTMGLMISENRYYFNVKITTITALAWLLDIVLPVGFFSNFLSWSGFPSTGYTKLTDEDGVRCIVSETLRRNPKVGSVSILEPFKGMCCNNHMNCGFRDGDRCTCTADNILSIYERMSERNMFKRYGDVFEYQW
ncbi:MAG: hypothetical protein IJZ39_04560 [Oscillospiraceae bacterium]|nr:hypothetical protein [Oscillospiraceae bacterium]